MASWKGIVAKSFSPAAFTEYAKVQDWAGWRPSFIVLHNTATPSLAQRPEGLTLQHIRNLEAYYRDQMHWSAGPHLFVDDKQIWVFTPLTTSGVHSPSWNSVALGIEMLGDYAKESFSIGRGALVRRNAVAAMAALNNVLGFKPDAFRFHVEDKATDHDCPGRLARACRAELVREITLAMNAPEIPPAPSSSVPLPSPPKVVPADKARAPTTSWGAAFKKWFWSH